MGFVQRRYLKGVLWVVAHPKWTLGIGAALLLVSIASAMHWLRMSTDQDTLVSPKLATFARFLDFDRRFPENQATYVLIEPKKGAESVSVARWVGAADAVAARLKQLQPRYIRPEPTAISYKVPLKDPAAPGILFQNSADFPETVQDISREVGGLAGIWGEKPTGLTGLLARISNTPIGRFLAGLNAREPDEQSARFVRHLADSWNRALEQPAAQQAAAQAPNLQTMNAQDPGQLGYFFEVDRTDPSRHMVLIQIDAAEDLSSLKAQYASVDAIRNAVAEVAANYPEFDVGVTGRPVLDADEMKITDRDSHRAEVVALSVVFVGLVLLLRSFWLAIVAEVSLAVGIGWTFGWATISVGELNLLSLVFLIALIGIGMDYLIQILAAYRREARRYVRPSAIWARVFRHVGPPVITACLGAAGAFFVSIFTDFRGAAQLGIIAGGGLLLCLLAGYTILPAILVLVPARLEAYPVENRYGAAPRRTRLRLMLPCIWVLLVLAGIPYMRKTTFNPNLLDLQAPNLESVQLIKRLQTWSAVVLSNDLDMLRKVRNAVKDAPVDASTESILTAMDNDAWLRAHQSEVPKIQWAEPAPVAPEDLPSLARQADGLAGKIAPAGSPATAPANREMTAAANSLRHFARAITAPNADANKVARNLSAWQQAFVTELKSMLQMLHPPPLEVKNIPDQIRKHLASDVDQPPGQYVYALYIYPKKDLWQRENLEQFEKEVETRVASVPGAPYVTGVASNMYTTSAVERSFYQATAYALGLIFILVLIDLRDLKHTLIAVSVLALGLPMLIALMGILHVDWNFANFFGLPILIGAGHEYGVFMMHRYKEALHNPRRVWQRRDPADRALLLCAFVTTSSFGFFWALGHHKGLVSLGLVMAMGTACIYLATILVVRPLLTWRLEWWRQQVEAGGFEVAPDPRLAAPEPGTPADNGELSRAEPQSQREVRE